MVLAEIEDDNAYDYELYDLATIVKAIRRYMIEIANDYVTKTPPDGTTGISAPPISQEAKSTPKLQETAVCAAPAGSHSSTSP